MGFWAQGGCNVVNAGERHSRCSHHPPAPEKASEPQRHPPVYGGAWDCLHNDRVHVCGRAPSTSPPGASTAGTVRGRRGRPEFESEPELFLATFLSLPQAIQPRLLEPGGEQRRGYIGRVPLRRRLHRPDSCSTRFWKLFPGIGGSTSHRTLLWPG